MTQAAIGGPAQTTYRVTDRALVTGRDAQRVFVVADGRPAEGGPQQAVYYVSDAEIAAGDFVISGNKPIPIIEVGAAGAEYPPIAVYVVTVNSESDFPPVPVPVAPQFASAEIGNVDNLTIVVTFDMDVSAAGDDYLTGVVVNVNGLLTVTSSGTRQANHAIVHYVITTPVANGDTVTWNYNDTTGLIVSEADGIPLADVAQAGVTNNVAPSGPVLLLDLEADTSVATDTTPFAGTGTITQSGTRVTGSGTQFAKEVVIGDRITSAGIDGIIQVFQPGESFDLDTTATVAVGESFTITPQTGTARVNDWSDAQGNHFTATGIQRSSLQTVGGFAAVVSDGNDDILVGPNDVADNLASFTIFCVENNFPAAGSANLIPFISKMNNLSSGAGWMMYQAGFNIVTQEDGGSVYYEQDYSTALDFGKHIYTYEFVTKNQFNFYVDGVLLTPASVNDSGPVLDMSTVEPIRINIDGKASDGISAARQHYAIRIYSGIFAALDRATIEAALATRYGITL